MSGFFGSSEGTRWGGLLKQAISNVETTFDSLLEQNEAAHQQDGRRPVDGADGMETETFVDPISGAVTTIQRAKKSTVEPKSPTYTSRTMPSPGRQSSDLSSRLAAVLSEKGRKTSSLVNSPESPRTPRTPQTLQTESSVASSVQPKLVEAKEQSSDKPPGDSSEKTNEISTEISIDPIIEQSKEDSPEAVPVAKEPITLKENEMDDKDSELVELDDKKAPESSEEIKDTPIVTALEVNESQLLSSPPIKTVDEPNRILEQRELQLLQAMETIAKLHDQIHQSQLDTEKTNQNYQKAKEEIKGLKSQLETSQAGKPAGQQKSVKKLENTIEELKQQISSKEEQIQGLMHEGEKLSKNELKHSTTIKKLRSEKAENDKLVAEMQKRQDKVVLDLMDANTKITKAAETEKRLQGMSLTLKESVKMLSDMTERQTKHINRLESEAIVSKEQHAKTQAILDANLASLEEEREKLKTESEEVHAAALEKEVKANDRLYKELSKAKEDAEAMETKLRKEESLCSLKITIRDLHIALQTQEEHAGTCEDNLRCEIYELRQRLQASEARMEDMGDGEEEATASLLHQIEDLQAQHALAIKSRDQTEKNMLQRLQAAEKEHKHSLEKMERSNELLQVANEQLQKLESELLKERASKTALFSRLEVEQASKAEYEQRIHQLEQKEQDSETQAKNAAEKIKVQYQKLLKDRIQDERRQWEEKIKMERSSRLKSPESYSPSSNSIPEEDNSTQAHQFQNAVISTRSSFDSGYTGGNTHPIGTSTIIVERLQANIRQLENQISFYQTQLQSSLQSRDELSEEMLGMTLEMDKLRKECKRMQDTETQLQKLHERYQASLEMLGERTEQVQELKADIADVKEMYRSQIIEMVQKIDQLSKK
ncbi:TATA element modulatory factor 1 TATA binding-domain-containing protein [Phycomyces blakesleeanus]